MLAIMLLALLAMLALVLDGGTLYLRRREAQNAADAGALAGARALCLTKDANQAVFMARQYAEVHNSADSSQPIVGTEVVTVTTQASFDTYFAHFIGFPRLTASAIATAGCFPPTNGAHVLPVAWACRPPIHGVLSSSKDCQEQAITPERLKNYIQNPPPAGEIYPELYIIMDSNAEPDDLSEICMSDDGWLNCDMDGDGDDDLLANGDRSWLDLNGGGGGASELISWLKSGFSNRIADHTWFGGQSGVENSVFQAIGKHVGEVYILPAFNKICDGEPEAKCSSEVHPEDTIIESAGGNYYYHVIAFIGFYVSCVNAPGVPGAECPGHKLARDLLLIKANTKTIEGYFVLGIMPNSGGGKPGAGVDTGVYSLKLIR